MDNFIDPTFTDDREISISIEDSPLWEGLDAWLESWEGGRR